MKRLPGIKQGDSFSLSATLRNPNGQALVGIASNLKAQVRDKNGNLYTTLQITESYGGAYILQTSDTSSWPVGLLMMDIQYTDLNGIVSSTETMQIPVGEDVTKDG